MHAVSFLSIFSLPRSPCSSEGFSCFNCTESAAAAAAASESASQSAVALGKGLKERAAADDDDDELHASFLPGRGERRGRKGRESELVGSFIAIHEQAYLSCINDYLLDMKFSSFFMVFSCTSDETSL
jgi:hypothetical protein